MSFAKLRSLISYDVASIKKFRMRVDLKLSCFINMYTSVVRKLVFCLAYVRTMAIQIVIYRIMHHKLLQYGSPVTRNFLKLLKFVRKIN